MVVVLARDPHELERRLDHARRRVAVAVHDAVGQRAVVRADAHGHAALLALQHQRREALLDARDFGGIVGVGVLAHAKELLVGEVARVDADLFDVLGGFQRGGRAEVDVGHQRHVDALARAGGA